MQKEKFFTLATLCLFTSMSIFLFIPRISEAAPAEKVIEWRLQSLLVPGQWAFAEGIKALTDYVWQASGGRFKITAYGSGVLIPPGEVLDAVRSGTIQMGHSTGAYWTGKIAVGAIEHHIPFTIRNYLEMECLWKEKKWNDIFGQAYAEQNVKWLGVINTAGNAVMSTKPIRSLNDMKKLKLRTASPGADILKSVGVPIVMVPGSEIYSALSTGVIDGATWGAATSERDIKLYEAAKFFLKTYSGDIASECVIANMDAWKNLPDDLKAILLLAVQAANDKRMRYYYVSEITALNEMVEKHGVKVTELPEADVAVLRNASMAFLEKLKAKDPKYSAKAIDILKNFMHELGYMK